jgi:tungstate transport system substrate-binding protein
MSLNTLQNARVWFPLAAALAWATACGAPAVVVGPEPAADAQVTGPVRVAVIGGMSTTGFFQAAATRFTHDTGIAVDIVATGPKDVLAAAVRAGQVDLVTLHSCDTFANLAADGYVLDLQPWLRNDLLLVGPPDDPAQVRGSDAVEAMRRIVRARAPFVLHPSLGVNEVLRDLTHEGGVDLDPEATTVVLKERFRPVLQLAEEKHAYVVVGRVPFRNGKQPHTTLVPLVERDPRLRRPYLVAVVNPQRVPTARLAAARVLQAWLRSTATQAWVAEYGRGQIDDQPLFLPVAAEAMLP